MSEASDEMMPPVRECFDRRDGSYCEYLGHHDPERWVVPGADEPEPVSAAVSEAAVGGETRRFDAGAST